MLNCNSTHASETMRDTHFPTHYLSSGERDVYRQLGEEDAMWRRGKEQQEPEERERETTCLEAKAQRKPETEDTWF